ncbi:hypothetical protein [Achromobacter phage Motura]|uniref:Uncharacterized protein n=1 Tax=Achromobacter phage Motura TaxID=2591403 RepID=A0A514CSS4_9CAUD|nr:hypothetical protein H1O15_gp291 [Achromobacter phage Motura]QDH83515.1 hypothetical protein [Achromobacter phage Motura]
MGERNRRLQERARRAVYQLTKYQFFNLSRLTYKLSRAEWSIVHQLLKTKVFKSEFRKKSAEKIRDWLEFPRQESPFTDREWWDLGRAAINKTLRARTEVRQVG